MTEQHPRQTKSYLKQLFEERGIRPKNKLGQNFLVDLNLIDLLVRAAELSPDDLALEVGRSRAQTYPELGLRRRPYSQAWEKKHWDYQLVAAHLANYSVTRRVDSKGQISIYGRNHYVGKPKIGQDVYLMFDPLDQEWIVSDAQGNQLKRHQAEEITPERIRKLQVTHRS